MRIECVGGGRAHGREVMLAAEEGVERTARHILGDDQLRLAVRRTYQMEDVGTHNS